jgi:ABC-2 type transport system ATP-binding protein
VNNAEPQVLLLDEPTTGVDTIARREFWDILAGLTAQNITVLVATPDLDEAERCVGVAQPRHRVALIYNGQIQQMGSPTELKGNLGLNRLIIRTSQLIEAEKALIVTGEIVEVSTLGDRLEVLVKDVKSGIAFVRDRLTQKNVQFDQIQPESPTLENVFTTLLRQKGSVPKSLPFPRVKSLAFSEPAKAKIAISARNSIAFLVPFTPLWI